MQQVHDFERDLMREALIPSSKGARLRETFPAFGAYVSPAVITQNQGLPAQLQISNGPQTVIVDVSGLGMAARAALRRALHSKENPDFRIGFPEFFALNPFQSEQF